MANPAAIKVPSLRKRLREIRVPSSDWETVACVRSVSVMPSSYRKVLGSQWASTETSLGVDPSPFCRGRADFCKSHACIRADWIDDL